MGGLVKALARLRVGHVFAIEIGVLAIDALLWNAYIRSDNAGDRKILLPAAVTVLGMALTFGATFLGAHTTAGNTRALSREEHRREVYDQFLTAVERRLSAQQDEQRMRAVREEAERELHALPPGVGQQEYDAKFARYTAAVDAHAAATVDLKPARVDVEVATVLVKQWAPQTTIDAVERWENANEVSRSAALEKIRALLRADHEPVP